MSFIRDVVNISVICTIPHVPLYNRSKQTAVFTLFGFTIAIMKFPEAMIEAEAEISTRFFIVVRLLFVLPLLLLAKLQ